jgi:putative drug exporter of the RND superfamily
VAVTVGIVLAAFVISVFLVPAVTALIGTRAWWPGRVDRRDPGGPATGAATVAPGQPAVPEEAAEPAEDRSRS